MTASGFTLDKTKKKADLPPEVAEELRRIGERSAQVSDRIVARLHEERERILSGQIGDRKREP